MSKAKKAADKQILELSVALEITKFQRDAYREQIAKLEQSLADADRRAERAEQRLHEATLMLSNLAMQSVTATTRSNATEVLVDGKSILRLNNPIASASREQTQIKPQA
jgi:chromosome segregation ATPase